MELVMCDARLQQGMVLETGTQALTACVCVYDTRVHGQGQQEQ